MLRILSKKKPPQFLKDAKHPVSFAFKSGDTDYFQFEDPLNTPYKRGFTALTFYREMRMHMTREYISDHTKAMDGILGDPQSISIGKISLLNEQMKERLDFVFEPDTAYKFASVVYFDKTEDPTKYDFDYGQKKIEKWKADSSVSDFFLQAPLIRLMPFLKDFDGDLNTYSKTVEAITKLHSERLYRILSTMKSRTASAKNSTSSAGSPQASKATG